MLGHTPKHCPYSDDISSQMKKDAVDTEKPCIDCTARNKSLEGKRSARSLHINPDHPTGEYNCPILKRHKNKSVNKWSQVEFVKRRESHVSGRAKFLDEKHSACLFPVLISF
jgi:hypothetical protein